MKNTQNFEIKKDIKFEDVSSFDEQWFVDWPIVYILHNTEKIYIGETLSAKQRLATHSKKEEKRTLENINIILSEYFNKSATLNLESELINLFFADGKFTVVNGNRGVVKSNYFSKKRYEKIFQEIFEELRRVGLFRSSIEDIKNNILFKLSPFKSLTMDQAQIASKILTSISEISESRSQDSRSIVIDGMPGTGKTVLAMFLLKFIADIAKGDDIDRFQVSDDFEQVISNEVLLALRGINVGFVIPQKSLRESVKKIIKQIPNLNENMVFDPFSLGKNSEKFDILIVDEAHRLGQRANQSVGKRNKDFREINKKLFGEDSNKFTQFDWVKAKSKIQILFVDEYQSVRPGDLPLDYLRNIINSAKKNDNYYALNSQMRMNAPSEYIKWIQNLLNGRSGDLFDLGDYEFEFFDSVNEMKSRIIEKEKKYELSRLIAGYAWQWVSKKDKSLYDIQIEDVDGEVFRAKWNSVDADWVASLSSLNEVGSIHTIQGYDLNYAGVIIGRDIYMDPETSKVCFDRNNYFDKKGKENNNIRGVKYSDEEILKWIQNIYRVLLTRGVMGTYFYVCDETLREFMKNEYKKLKSYNDKLSSALHPDIIIPFNNTENNYVSDRDFMDSRDAEEISQ